MGGTQTPLAPIAEMTALSSATEFNPLNDIITTDGDLALSATHCTPSTTVLTTEGRYKRETIGNTYIETQNLTEPSPAQSRAKEGAGEILGAEAQQIGLFVGTLDTNNMRSWRHANKPG